jgi:Trp operon repressor
MEQQQENQVQWRRHKIQELCSKGYSQGEISQMLQVVLATVNRDISYLRINPTPTSSNHSVYIIQNSIPQASYVDF